MGCDIHFYIEVKTKNGWELYNHSAIERDYALFTKLAGVRNVKDIDPISEPKGLPDNISYLVKKSYEDWGVDAHSASYITGKEIHELSEWIRKGGFCKKSDIPCSLEYDILHTWLEGGSFAGFYKYPEDRVKWIKDIRFIFWFDN